MTTFTKRGQRQKGFTLVELLATISLVGILLTLGVFALRQFWFVRSLDGAKDQVITQLRAQQQRVISETHPLVYGARFVKDSSSWYLVRFDPAGSVVAGVTSPTCQAYQTLAFDSGVIVKKVNFENAGAPTTTCTSSISGSTDKQFVFFFARGNATDGEIQLEHPVLERRKDIEIFGITGRVEEA